MQCCCLLTANLAGSNPSEMFHGLQNKWKVSAGRLVLILMTFAIVGSLTGYVGKRLMLLTGIENTALYIIVYILLVTLVWPAMVLIISIPFGQFVFFKTYLARMGKRLHSSGRTKNSYIKRAQEAGRLNSINKG